MISSRKLIYFVLWRKTFVLIFLFKTYWFIAFILDEEIRSVLVSLSRLIGMQQFRNVGRYIFKKLW